MLLIIMGKTCAGKDKIVKELIQRGFEKIVTYTTRPPRKDEVPGLTYHYILDEDFKDKIEKGFFLEYKAYEAADGSTWLYGLAFESLENISNTDKKVIILTPDGYRDFLHKKSIPHKAIYLHVNNATIKSRLIKRGDNKAEAELRIKRDSTDFKGVENEVDRIVYNNDEADIIDVTNSLLKYLGGK